MGRDLIGGKALCLPNVRNSPAWNSSLAHSAPLGNEGLWATTVAPGVTVDLTTDRASVAAQGARDVRLAEALFSERGKCISLFGGELVVSHESRLSLAGEAVNSAVRQLASTPSGRSRRFVALSM